MKTYIKISKDEHGFKIKQEFITKTNQLIKKTKYEEDGITNDIITEYNPQTGNRTKLTQYYDPDEKIDYIIEFNPYTGEETKEINYQNNSTTIDYIYDYSINSPRKPTPSGIKKYEKEYQKYKQD